MKAGYATWLVLLGVLRSCPTNAATDGSSKIREDVAKQIVGDNDVVARRILDHINARRINMVIGRCHIWVLGGNIVDDNGLALDERALSGIASQLDAVRAKLEARGVTPGSPTALRLFS